MTDPLAGALKLMVRFVLSKAVMTVAVPVAIV
jgi:hypothetical protein